MNIEEWGTPVSRDKIIYRRNNLIEYQKTNQVRFTPLYETIDENILDINYMIYEIDKLQSNWNSLREWLEKEYKKYDIGIKTYGQAQVEETLNKMNELEGENKQ